MIALARLSREDAALIATALLVAAGRIPNRIPLHDMRHCVALASDIRDGLPPIARVLLTEEATTP